jgi:hypothetical protein
MSTIDHAGNIHTGAGAPGAGRFAGRANPAPTAGLSAPPRTFFVRTRARVHRVLAYTALDAQAAVASGFPQDHIIGMADPDVHVSAQAGPVIVKYDWVGEGVDGDYDPSDPHDQPLLRLSVQLAGGESVGFEGGSWCTGTPSTSDPNVISSRAISVARMLAAQTNGKSPEDQAYLIERFLRRSADVPDPVISVPTTPEEAAAAYPQRDRGMVMGYSVVSVAGGLPDGQAPPFAHAEEAEHHQSTLSSRGREYEVRMVPVRMPDGSYVSE